MNFNHRYSNTNAAALTKVGRMEVEHVTYTDKMMNNSITKRLLLLK